MKIVVTHNAPDWDAIGSVWLIKKYVAGWQDARVEFVPAGTRKANCVGHNVNSETDPIEVVGEDEIIHVDTGLGPLDHHQTSDQQTCATTLVWKYVQKHIAGTGAPMKEEHVQAVSRIVTIILADDHFREIFWAEPLADYHEFSLIGLLEGLKQLKPGQDEYCTTFGQECLDALVHAFESRIWAEKEIKENGITFPIKSGKDLPMGKLGIAFETINDNVIKLAQKMGYLLVVRKDPRKGYVRIKVRPASTPDDDIDLTAAYDKLKKIDPDATWFLHVSKKMLLNGTAKNPAMVPTKLTIEQIVDVLTNLY